MDTDAEIAALLKQITEAYQAGVLDKATVLCEALLKRDPYYHEAVHLYGLILAKQQRLPEALYVISQAIEQTPNNPLFYSNQSLAYRQLQQWQQAIEDYQRAIHLVSATPPVTVHGIGRPQLGLCQIMSREGGYPEYDYVFPLVSLSHRLHTQIDIAGFSVSNMAAPIFIHRLQDRLDVAR